MNLVITLNRGAVSESTDSLNLHAFPLYVEALSNINLENDDSITPNEQGLYPCNIFVFQANGTGLDPNQGDRFFKVANAADLDNYPSYDVSIDDTTPITSIDGYPFFRYNQIKLFMEYPEEIEEVWNYIQEDVTSLVNEYNSLQNLTTTDSVTISGTA